MRREKPLGRSRAEIASGTERALHANCVRGGRKLVKTEIEFFFCFVFCQIKSAGGEGESSPKKLLGHVLARETQGVVEGPRLHRFGPSACRVSQCSPTAK